jgi:hypothetical protein
MNMKIIYIIFTLLFINQNIIAQIKADTVPGSTIIKVKSSFKPVIRNTPKEIFYAIAPSVDSTKPQLNYNVPAQNLFFSYQPVPLKPLAMNIKNDNYWENNNYIKLGFGNFITPHIGAGFSFGDGKTTSLGIFADYISSKGKLKYQDYSKIALTAQGSVSTPKGFEFNSSISYNLDDYNYYGYNTNLYNFTKTDVDQKLSTIAFTAGMRNTVPTEYGLNYNPTLTATIFGDNRKANETNLALTVPLSKNIGKNLSFKIGGKADFTFHKSNILDTGNHIFYVMPGVVFKSEKFSINGGVTPAFENGKSHILPDITADFQVNRGKKFVAQLGWIGYFNKGTYQNWSKINPYISQPNVLYNTKVDEKFIGFKGTSGNHFVYSAKAAYVTNANIPLFVNDSGSGKSFRAINEQQLDNLQIHGEFGIMEKEAFHFIAGATFNNFINQKTELENWGILPLELNASMRWQFAKDFWLKLNGYSWSGALFKTPSNTSSRMPFVFDLNAGVEFKVAKQFNVWFQGNNLLNNKYQRWRNYEVYGLNVLGGIKYTFTGQRKALFNVAK